MLSMFIPIRTRFGGQVDRVVWFLNFAVRFLGKFVVNESRLDVYGRLWMSMDVYGQL